MPIFEYVCQDCKKRFEQLVYGSTEALCPLCHSKNLDQQISVFSVRSAKPVSTCEAAAGCGGGCAAAAAAGAGGGCCPYD